MDGFVWVPVSSLVLSLKSCIADPDFYCFNFLRQIYLNPCQINGVCHRNLCDFVPCGDLASQVCGGWFGKLNPRPCLAVWRGKGCNNKNWKEQRPNNQKNLNKTAVATYIQNPRQYTSQESTFSLTSMHTRAIYLLASSGAAVDCSPETVAEIWQGCRSDADQPFEPVLSGCSKPPGAVEAASP